ncbi:MAG: M3 family oligoendopeptidase [Deltaproteobacteria bacterium]|nr:M3 family oligoendopeptidase [Deltaproteobacteria bacterium]
MTEDVIWDLGDLYDGPDDPRLKADRDRCLEKADHFAEVYARKGAHPAPEGLHEALSRLEKIEETCRRVVSFAYLSFITQTADPRIGRLWQSAQELESTVRRKTLFFSLEWTGLDDPQARSLMEHEMLRSYRHYLERLRAYRPHHLSEPEEQAMEALSLSSRKAWVDLFDKVIGQAPFGEEARPLSRVLADLYHPERERRRKAALDLSTGLEGILPLVAHICNALLLDKSLRDDLHFYPHWLRDMNLRNEACDDQVEALVHAVTSRYDLVRDYYTLKREILGIPELWDYDRYAPLPGWPHKVYTWKEAGEMVLAAFHDFSPEFAQVADLFFQNHWIHAAPIPGKADGAFSHPTVPSCHPYISLHFTGTRRDVMTLAHELGHGVHQVLCREQGLYNSRVPPALGEIASVFGEMLVFRRLLERAQTAPERLAILCGRVEEIFSTTFRQIALHRFEASLHTERRSHGELTPERICDLWTSTQQEMFGDSLLLGNHYCVWWAYIPHFFHYPGYVHAYAFAELTALSLFEQYERDKLAFVVIYLDLLKRGSSEGPEEMMKPFGIDLSDPAFFRQGLTIVEDLVREAWKSTIDTSSPRG